jgi:hypothetical protein
MSHPTDRQYHQWDTFHRLRDTTRMLSSLRKEDSDFKATWNQFTWPRDGRARTQLHEGGRLLCDRLIKATTRS